MNLMIFTFLHVFSLQEKRLWLAVMWLNCIYNIEVICASVSMWVYFCLIVWPRNNWSRDWRSRVWSHNYIAYVLKFGWTPFFYEKLNIPLKLCLTCVVTQFQQKIQRYIEKISRSWISRKFGSDFSRFHSFFSA